MQTVIVSVPVIPTQPSQGIYSVEYLNLFHRYDRASYAATFGEKAPPYNPARRQKSWFDTSLGGADTDVTQYHAVQVANGVATIAPIIMSVAEARQINLAGVEDYPAPTPPAPSGVLVRNSIFNSTSVVDPQKLSTPEQANQIAQELGAMFVIADLGTAASFYEYQPGESRKPYEIVLKSGVHFNVGLLLFDKNQYGVGAPGHWLNAETQPKWAHDYDPGQLANNDVRPPWPMPVRDLLPNEKFWPNPFGMQIQRTDMGVPDTAGFADIAALAAQVQKLQAGLNAILKALSLPQI